MITEITCRRLTRSEPPSDSDFPSPRKEGQKENEVRNKFNDWESGGLKL